METPMDNITMTNHQRHVELCLFFPVAFQWPRLMTRVTTEFILRDQEAGGGSKKGFDPLELIQFFDHY